MSKEAEVGKENGMNWGGTDGPSNLVGWEYLVLARGKPQKIIGPTITTGTMISHPMTNKAGERAPDRSENEVRFATKKQWANEPTSPQSFGEKVKSESEDRRELFL